MKDWELRKETHLTPAYERQWGKYYLVHHHGNNGIAVVRWYGPVTGWHCIRCGAVPPEEMQIVAELAGCP